MPVLIKFTMFGNWLYTWVIKIILIHMHDKATITGSI